MEAAFELLSILSGECLAREPLLNEHFNNPLPQRSQQTVSRTEVTDGGTSRTLGPACREYVSGSGPVQDGSSSVVDECPICTESYQSRGDRSMALLNCDHSLCQRCLAAMLRRAADCSRILHHQIEILGHYFETLFYSFEILHRQFEIIIGI
uniref:RING-type domain-containing protein n=1 Tax=Astyanax mexicanus TaxID=7994 RepID=A0A8B9K0G3_ASTMX